MAAEKKNLVFLVVLVLSVLVGGLCEGRGKVGGDCKGKDSFLTSQSPSSDC